MSKHKRAWLPWLMTAILGGAASLAIDGIDLVERERAHAGLSALVDEVAVSVREDFARILAELEMHAHNAASNPRLVAAIGADVNASTLRDIFETEPWWQPYRETFSSHTLAEPDGTIEPLTGDAIAAEVAQALADQARRRARPVARLVAEGGQARAIVAAPVALPNRTVVPVMLLARALSAADVAPIARRLDRAVLLTHGEQALLGAGPMDQTERLRDHVGRGRRGGADDRHDETFAVASADLGAGLALLSHVAATPERQMQTTFAVLRVAACVVAALMSALFFLARPRTEESPSAPAHWTGAQSTAFGRYILLDRIGGGGMAEVFLAVSLGESGFRRPCVVKRLRPELAENPAAVAQFTDEATVASSLVHSNIVPIFDFGRADDHYFLVQEYIAGRDLGRITRRLSEQGRATLGVNALAYIACELLKALDYVHNKVGADGKPLGLVHRDISPENAMITLRGEVKLLDFGVLKAAKGRTTKTEFGALKGNVSFMSPEQARSQEVDARADLFSLGLVLFYCLRGETLYGDTGSYAILVKAGGGLDAADRGKIADLPAPFDVVLHRALAPRIEDRYQSAAAFARDLLPWTDGGAAEVATVMAAVFDDDLRTEQHALGGDSVNQALEQQAGPDQIRAAAGL